MHLWDRYMHRIAISQQTNLRRTTTANTSLMRLRDLGIPVEEQLDRINESLKDIDQLLIPSTINNFINQRFILKKEREIIAIFEECDARALNYLIGHVKLGLLFYKIKDHRNFNGKHRTELINLLAIERLSILTVISRVIVLHSLQLLKLRANPRAEYWVRNILLNTHQDELSELKTLTDAKGDYFCMNKLIFDDIRSESVRQDILNHLRREAAVKMTHLQMGTRRTTRKTQYRKVLSDVDDTLTCSGGMYPAGIDKRYPKKEVYPGVLAFYRELDIGTEGPEEWLDEHVGNLVFLSARPHLYKDISEKANFAKFEKLRARGNDGRQGLHTTPSLLAGDLVSGGQYIYSNDFEPLAKKKFDNFRRYVSIYPEYQHVFVCDNGQGDVRAGEMMFDSFPYEFEALYVHVVQDIPNTHGYSPERWREKDFKPCWFRTYPEAALDAASRHPPLIRIKGLQRICHDAAKDFVQIKSWADERMKASRRMELNQAIWKANSFLVEHCEEPVELIRAERRFLDGEKVRTPYGIGKVQGFDPVFDLYLIELDWRPLDVQVAEHNEETKKAAIRPKVASANPRTSLALETVVETDEVDEELVLSMDTRSVASDKRSDRVSVQEVGQSSAEESPLSPPLRSQSMPVRLRPPPQLDDSSVDSQSLSAATEPPTSTDFEEDDTVVPKQAFSVVARLTGRSITKYTPPVLPKLDAKARGSLFTFLHPGAEAKPKRVIFKGGTEVSTPFGPAKIVEHREKSACVVVEMMSWHARAYLREGDVKLASPGLLRSLMRQLSKPDREKPLEFPHVEGTVIVTPFGKGRVSRPIPVDRLKSSRSPVKAKSKVPTLGICLESWVLADGSHPMLYCTTETARTWKDRKDDGSSIFSALGTLVESSRTLLEPFLAQRPQPPPEAPKLHTRYYADAASVTTSYGDGVVVGFRPTDGFYKVSLVKWTLARGTHPTAYLRRNEISHRVAKGCHEGYPVLTSLGLSGTLASVEPTTGVHIVTVPTAGMVCYLQPECVVQPLKAAVGEEVLTAFGEGKVVGYNKERDMYTIKLSGFHATLYAKGDTFERSSDGVQDRDGMFGVNWLLRFLFFPTPEAPRSRSNSMSSMISGSSRSVS